MKTPGYGHQQEHETRYDESCMERGMAKLGNCGKMAQAYSFCRGVRRSRGVTAYDGM